MEVGMELRALRARHAVDRPNAALLVKRTVIGRVPVPRGEDREPAHVKRGHIKVQDLDDLVASRYAKRAAWHEIVLHVHDEQAIAGMEVHVNPPRSLCLIVYPKRRTRQLYSFHPILPANETGEPRPRDQVRTPPLPLRRLAITTSYSAKS